jgi:hypothetical protein
MAKPLPQQQLLLELLSMSGEIAVLGPRDDSLLWRTLEECQKLAWVKLTTISADTYKVELRALGRAAMA